MKAKTPLKEALDRKGLQQNQLATVTGLSPAAVSLMCLGKSQPAVGVAIKVARAIGEPVETLFANWVRDL